MSKILIVDDEPSIREGLKAALSGHKLDILTASDGLEALSLLEQQSIDLLISDIKMPKMDGLKLQNEALKMYPSLPIILLTAYGSIETAVEAMRKGAYDFLTKPINIDKFELLVLRALENTQIKEENKRLKETLKLNKGLENIIGHSKKMLELFERIKVIANTRSTVLIYGESGTGKELIASAIHNLSPRKEKPFVVVNCAALSENLLESELFGHEKGSFTGASAKKDGRFKAADTGTLFLDEIGELSPKIQVKLLRVLQEKSFEPVGTNNAIKVDVRFIAATNKNLEELVKKGTFREDLFFRLNVLKIDAPPLRERKEDIPLLVNYFLNKFSKENSRNVKSFSNDALKQLSLYSWPGNVRELQNLMENIVVFAKEDTVSKETLPDYINNPQTQIIRDTETLNIIENEKKLILQALTECKYNKTLAAKKLGMSRRTIHRKINEYGIDND